MTDPRPYPIDPVLPDGFDSTPNERRPASHAKWWERPFIQTYTLQKEDDHFEKMGGHALQYWTAIGRAEWLRHWPTGTRYDVRCLDGGAWDRSSAWGCFQTLEEAEACCASGPSWRK